MLLVDEFDYVAPVGPADTRTSPPVAGFLDDYLTLSQGGAEPIDYLYAYVAPSSTGVPSGLDLNSGGTVGGPDAWGFDFFPGRYGMLVLSQHRIDVDAVRTSQHFRWGDMPGALLPDDPETAEPGDWWPPEVRSQVRPSSTSHWDVPVLVGGSRCTCSPRTPPRRCSTARRTATAAATTTRSGPGRPRRRPPGRGLDLGSAQQLLDHPRVTTRLAPSPAGATAAAALRGGANLSHGSDPAPRATCAWTTSCPHAT